MSGLTPQESAIMALWDSGAGTRAIARALDVSEARRTIWYYNGASELRRAKKDMIAGSAALAAAIRAQRPA